MKEAVISVAHGLPEIEHLFREHLSIHSNNHKLYQPTTHDKDDENLDFRCTVDVLLPLYFKVLSLATLIAALCGSGRLRGQKMINKTNLKKTMALSELIKSYTNRKPNNENTSRDFAFPLRGLQQGWVSPPGHYTFLANCPPTPPLSQHFPLSEK